MFDLSRKLEDDLLVMRQLGGHLHKISYEVLARVRDWNARRVRPYGPVKRLIMRIFQARSTVMQRQFTMELRVDYADNEKTKVMRQAMQQAARHVYATATLIADGVKPQIALFSDDFFTGHEQIELLEDTISQGVQAIDNGEPEEEISSELLAAATSKP